MVKIYELKIRILEAREFSPFGEVISAKGWPPDFEGASGTKFWEMDFEADGRLQLAYLRTPYQDLMFKTMEQHHGITQSFIPMSNSPSVVAVAPPTSTVPGPKDVKAFLLDGTQGYVLKRNTWHSLDRFSLYPPGSAWVILTDWETTNDLKSSPQQRGEKLTWTVDFEMEQGIIFKFVL